MKKINFLKMSGTGNDFIMIDNYEKKEKITVPEIGKICDRHQGIGADGILVIESPPSDENDFYMRYYNADGSEAEMCGNGARCIARFAYIKKYAASKMRFLAKDGEHYAEVRKDGTVSLSMIDPRDLQKKVDIKTTAGIIKGTFINTGVPHFIIPVNDIEKVDVKNLGREIRLHKYFAPKGTNVNFVQAKSGIVNIRTYERGVEDETLACGTGAVAAAVTMHILKNIKKPVTIKTRGGVLKVNFSSQASRITNVFLEGNAKIIAEGTILQETFK